MLVSYRCARARSSASFAAARRSPSIAAAPRCACVNPIHIYTVYTYKYIYLL